MSYQRTSALCEVAQRRETMRVDADVLVVDVVPARVVYQQRLLVVFVFYDVLDYADAPYALRVAHVYPAAHCHIFYTALVHPLHVLTASLRVV